MHTTVDLISEPEAAKLAGFSHETLRKLRMRGSLPDDPAPPHLRPRGQIRYDRLEFVEWLAARSRANGGTSARFDDLAANLRNRRPEVAA